MLTRLARESGALENIGQLRPIYSHKSYLSPPSPSTQVKTTMHFFGIALLFSFFPAVIQGSSTGASQCAVGASSAGGPHTSPDVNQTTGNLIDGGYRLTIGGKDYTSRDGFNVVDLVDQLDFDIVMESMTSEDFFRGVLIRVGGTTPDQVNPKDESMFRVASICSGLSGAITHISSDNKNRVVASVSLDADKDMGEHLVDVTVVKMNTYVNGKAVSEHYYANVKLNITTSSSGGVPAPTLPATQAPVTAPSAAPASMDPVAETREPVATTVAPTVAQSAIPAATTEAPVLSTDAPVSTPVAPVALSPLAGAPMATSPVASVPTADAPITTSPVGEAPVGAVPTASAPVRTLSPASEATSSPAGMASPVAMVVPVATAPFGGSTMAPTRASKQSREPVVATEGPTSAPKLMPNATNAPVIPSMTPVKNTTTMSPTLMPSSSKVNATMAPTVDMSIVKTLSEQGDLTVLLSLLEATGFDLGLRNDENVTLFAPTNASFAKVDPKFLTRNWEIHLRGILLMHVVRGAIVPATNLTEGVILVSSINNQINVTLVPERTDNETSTNMTETPVMGNSTAAPGNLTADGNSSVPLGNMTIENVTAAPIGNSTVDIEEGNTTIVEGDNSSMVVHATLFVDTRQVSSNTTTENATSIAIGENSTVSDNVTIVDNNVTESDNVSVVVGNLTIEENVTVGDGNTTEDIPIPLVPSFNGFAFDDVRLLETDMMADNGIVHKIDSLFWPDFMGLSLLAVVSNSFSFMAGAVVKAGAEELFKADNRTILIPDEAAGAPVEVVEMLGSGDQSGLTAWLSSYIFVGVFPTIMLVDGSMENLTTISGVTYVLSATNITGDNNVTVTAPMVANATVVVGDVPGFNGLLHVLDGFFPLVAIEGPAPTAAPQDVTVDTTEAPVAPAPKTLAPVSPQTKKPVAAPVGERGSAASCVPASIAVFFAAVSLMM